MDTCSYMFISGKCQKASYLMEAMMTKSYRSQIQMMSVYIYIYIYINNVSEITNISLEWQTNKFC